MVVRAECDGMETAMRDITAAMVTIDRSPNDNYLAQTLDSFLQSDLLTSARLESFTVFDSAADRWAEGVMLSDDQNFPETFI